MFKFKRPPKDATFDTSVKGTRRKVRKAIKAGLTVNFPTHWSKIKPAFMQAQHGKCGFCEGRVLGLQYGDVEHYHPKGAIDLLDHTKPSTWGQEKPWSAKIDGRTTTPHSSTGYWWKAYSWSNYLVACQVCNQLWKQCIFPTAPPSPRPRGKVNHRETPLLLNPFDADDPAKHLAFGRMGEVTAFAGSPSGHATILTCGLDRPSLRHARHHLARTTHERIDELSADITNHHLHALLSAILANGQAQAEHSGMVRAIFCQRMEMSWETLGEIVAKLATDVLLPPRRLCEC